MPNLAAPSAFMELLDIAFDEITPSTVRGSVAADERHHQPWGLVHGGLYTTVIETFATTGAYEAVKDSDQQAVGVSNTTDFLRPHQSGRHHRRGHRHQPGQEPAALAGRDSPPRRGRARGTRAGPPAQH